MSSENSMADHDNDLTTKCACNAGMNEHTAMLSPQAKNTSIFVIDGIYIKNISDFVRHWA
jgi:hypothetical protein